MLVPNEDGLGPTMAVFYLIGGLLKAASERECGISIRIQNKRGHDLLELLISKILPKELQEKTEPRPVKGAIELGKILGMVAPKKTRENLLRYIEEMERYIKETGTLRPFDAVVSFGSPEILRAAYEYEKKHRKRIHRFEIFDHAWSLTFEKILSEPENEQKLSRRFEDDSTAKAAVEAIKEDESLAERVWLFPEFLTSSEYYCHWKGIMTAKGENNQIIRKPVERITGVFASYDLPRTNDLDGRRKKAREEISQCLRVSIGDNDKVVVIQAGGTPVWDDFLGDVLKEILALSLTDYTFLFSERAVNGLLREERKKTMLESQVEGLKEILQKVPGSELFTQKHGKSLEKMSEKELEQFFQEVPGARYIRCISDQVYPVWQRVYLGSNLVFSRAGGITVQDCVACATPLVCVDEPGQWQTEKIKETCRLHGIAPTVSYSAFRGAAIGPILRAIAEKDQIAKSLAAMTDYTLGTELEIARKILSAILESKHYRVNRVV